MGVTGFLVLATDVLSLVLFFGATLVWRCKVKVWNRQTKIMAGVDHAIQLREFDVAAGKCNFAYGMIALCVALSLSLPVLVRVLLSWPLPASIDDADRTFFGAFSAIVIFFGVIMAPEGYRSYRRVLRSTK